MPIFGDIVPYNEFLNKYNSFKFVNKYNDSGIIPCNNILLLKSNDVKLDNKPIDDDIVPSNTGTNFCTCFVCV